MYRAAINQLKIWKEDDGRKPLVVRGARQVGKTWLLKEFARTCFKNTLYVNFEEDTQLQTLFTEDFNLERIINVLQIYTGEAVYPGDTLIILDEVQVAERGITSLKFFCEKYQPQTALRFSMKDYKKESWMINLPLYTVEHAL